jgi:pyridoxal phosphate enzyme (YggS family)
MNQTTTDTYAERLAGTLPVVRERIERAEEASGRAPGSVRLVAVTKSHPLEAVEAALAAGLTDLGENRVEELEQKVQAFGANAATWHMIGHLQSRKAPRAAAVADLIHSVDSLRLAEKLSRAAADEGRVLSVLAQVNTSGEASKSGFAPDDAGEEIVRMAELPGLRVDGLMTMAPFVDDEVVLGAAFGGLRRLAERLRAATDRIGPELSMGMTNDLEIAIREGSTMVRIGTALFGERGSAT